MSSINIYSMFRKVTRLIIVVAVVLTVVIVDGITAITTVLCIYIFLQHIRLILIVSKIILCVIAT